MQSYLHNYQALASGFTTYFVVNSEHARISRTNNFIAILFPGHLSMFIPQSSSWYAPLRSFQGNQRIALC